MNSSDLINFSQYHDSENTFHRKLKLFFCQCDEFHNLSLSSLQSITTDTAVEDYNMRNMSWDFLQQKGVGILLSRVSFHINKIPKANDIINVSTWEEKPEMLQLMRRYELTSETGESLVSGVSTWLVVDINTRKIMRTKDFTLRVPPEKVTECSALKCAKISLPDDMSLVEERVIRYTDIDGNGHMNNARYGSYIMDALPEEYQNRLLQDVRINFSHEACKNSKIQIFSKIQENNILVAAKQDGNTCFESELIFK